MVGGAKGLVFTTIDIFQKLGQNWRYKKYSEELRDNLQYGRGVEEGLGGRVVGVDVDRKMKV